MKSLKTIFGKFIQHTARKKINMLKVKQKEPYFKTLEDARTFAKPWIDKVVGDLCCSYDETQYNNGNNVNGVQNSGDWYIGANLSYLDYDLGRIQMDYVFDGDDYEKIRPHVYFVLNTRVTFEMKSIFTKSNMRHNIKIKLNCSKTFDSSDKDYKKFINWAKLIMKELKTAEAKKKRFEMDVDFE